ncbi:MAG: helix-turn-helix domain-containing protein [Chloroflexota bacterium]
MEESSFAIALNHLMQQSPAGPLSIAQLARRAGVPRSTVYRHLLTGKPTRRVIAAYAAALGVPEVELLRLAGFPTHEEGADTEADALTSEVNRMGREARELIWAVIHLLKKHGIGGSADRS